MTETPMQRMASGYGHNDLRKAAEAQQATQQPQQTPAADAVLSIPDDQLDPHLRLARGYADHTTKEN